MVSVVWRSLHAKALKMLQSTASVVLCMIVCVCSRCGYALLLRVQELQYYECCTYGTL